MQLTEQEERLLRLVHYRIDEAAGAALLPALQPEQAIRELDLAAREVMRKAPRSLTYPLATSGRSAANTWVGDEEEAAVLSPGGLRAPLPADLIRVLRVRLTNWFAPVDRLVDPEQQIYRQQFNGFQRATPHQPVAALIPAELTGISQRTAIEMFPRPAPLGANPVAELLVLVATSAGEMTLAVPDLEDAVCWIAAGRLILSEREGAPSAEQCFTAAAASLEAAAPDNPGGR